MLLSVEYPSSKLCFTSVSFDTLLFLVYGCSGQPNGIVTWNKVDEKHGRFHLKRATQQKYVQDTLYIRT